VEYADFARHDGATLLKLFKNSPSALLLHSFPEDDFQLWQFQIIPTVFYENSSEVRRFLEWVLKENGIMNPNDLKPSHFALLGVQRVLKRFNNSPMNVIQFAYGKKEKEVKEKGGKEEKESGKEEEEGGGGRRKKPFGYWNSVENQRRFVVDLGRKLGYYLKGEEREGEEKEKEKGKREGKGKEVEQIHYERFYELKKSDIASAGGLTLLTFHHRNSVYSLMKTVFPEYDWLPWRFPVTPKLSWNDDAILRKAVDYVEQQLKIEGGGDEWKRVSAAKLNDLGLLNLFHKSGGIDAVLEKTKGTKKN